MRILVIEDDVHLGSNIVDGLAGQGYSVDVAASHEDGTAMAADCPYDAIIVEMKMPARSSAQTCRELRQRGVAAPVLLLADSATTEDKVAGLDAGADDFQTSPISREEMLARVRSLLRRGTAQESDRLSCADLVMDLGRHQVSRAGATLTFTPREFALLEYFLHNQQRVLSRDEIARHVWDAKPSGMSNTIDVYVSMLRRKIDRGFEPPLIRTIVGYGYIFGAPDDQPASPPPAVAGDR